ncbi:uncharacterized protein LOC106872008 isoform X1 [Octopus bimaculoides]|uniref:uncharacterized protein LOC106872008 isoform X1 n=1 Tax=Octopus bimaculoides TaxID=37653 RepID=UPI00071D4C81|nr:uncharacterized protein LOC106872008 isoform X1 [Octopus bimaculoides]|eukprot:XP_014774300.1 PREDICTED: uncharacterized protein LOC106872008 isoform X1 [Octopus bimaculoides]
MIGKRKMLSSIDAPAKKPRKAIDLDCKMKIIRQYEGGKKVNTIARDLKLSHSTVSTILKGKERIREAVKSSVPMKSTILTKQRQGPIHEMEKLLFMWMKGLIQKKTPISLLTVQTKAKSLFQTLKSRSGDDYTQDFQASKGWFIRFKKRFALHNVCVIGEAGSADEEGAQKFGDSFDELIEGYLPEHIFNVDETDLLWKRRPTRKFEAPIEKSELNSIQSSQHSVETRKLQKVTVENDANLKQQTKATTRAQRNQLISVNTSNEVNSKLCKNNSEILLHPQSVVPPVQEKRILVVPNHQTAVMSNLFSMWKAGRLCDSYISNGTTTIMVHKMVLGAVCPKLLPILHHSSKGSFPKVTFPSSVSKEGLLAFAEYMYNGVVDLNEEILVQLKTIGERLSMKDFEQLCCNELNKAKTKDILSAVVEPLLAEPCSLSGLFPSRTQGDINKIQNSMLINLFRNNYSNSNNMQPGVLVSTGSSTSNVRSEEIMTTNQIIDIQSEVEPEIESATNHNSLQLKIEPYSPDENQHSFQEELYMDIGNTSSNNNHHLPPATSATSGNINTDNDLTVTYSDNQYKNDLNMVSSDNINISDAPQSEETCLSQHTENCDEDTDNQKELQLISITSVAGNINEDNLSNNSDLVETSSTMPTNTKQLQTSNSKPYPISLFSVNNGDYTAV